MDAKTFYFLRFCWKIDTYLTPSQAVKSKICHGYMNCNFYPLVKQKYYVNVGFVDGQLFFQVSEEYKLVPDTLYLTVNVIDRFLSQNYIEKKRLQLLGVSSMLIAS